MTHGDRQVWIVVLVVVSLAVRNVDTDLGLTPTTSQEGS